MAQLGAGVAAGHDTCPACKLLLLLLLLLLLQ
jgi:hypothetical protein